LADAGVVASGKQAKDALQRNAVIVNGQAYGMDSNMAGAEIFSADNAIFGRFFMVKVGKKKHHLFTK
jgi:tyrosyl-tRNA synthetase